MKNIQSFTNKPFLLVLVVILVIIILLGILRFAAPYLTLGFGAYAHVGSIRGAVSFETFKNMLEDDSTMSTGSSMGEPCFVMFYADWCGHCQRAKPQFQKLMQEYKGRVRPVLIDAMDESNKELVKRQNVPHFPTIRYYPKGMEGDFDEYNGERDFQSFLSYLQGLN